MAAAEEGLLPIGDISVNKGKAELPDELKQILQEYNVDDTGKVPPNCCGRQYKKSDPNGDPTTTAAFKNGLYGTLLGPITCYCHHFTEDGKHCVANGLGPENAKQCHGVMWGSVMSPTTLTCDLPREGPLKLKHAPCSEDRCPYLANGIQCPYTAEDNRKKQGKKSGWW